MGGSRRKRAPLPPQRGTIRSGASAIRILLPSASLLLLLLLGTALGQPHRPPRPPLFDDFDLTNATLYPLLDPLPPPGSPPLIEEVSASSPRLYLIHNALTPEECAHVRSVAAPTLRPSYVGTGGQGMRADPERRISSSTFLMTGSVFQTRPMRKFRRRISDVTGLDLRNFADLQANRYGPGGRYEPHVDWAGGAGDAEQSWTVLLCLSTAGEGEGGETVFPLSDPPALVRPVEGMAVVFRNVLSPGVVDPTSLHGGAPILRGEKWNANQWVFRGAVPFARRVSLPVLLRPWGGDPPGFVVRLRNGLVGRYGAGGGYRALNVLANAALGLTGAGMAALLGAALGGMPPRREGGGDAG